MSAAMGNQDREMITDKELSECDREKLHLIGNIQDGAGHVLFFSHPQGVVMAADLKVLDVPWIRVRDPSTARKDTEMEASSAKRPKLQFNTDASQSKISSSNGGRINEDARNVLGLKLEECIPARLQQDILEAIDTMVKAKSQRTFRFFSFEEENYAISVSTTTNDYSTVGIEIEVIEDFEATGNFYNTLVSLGRVMEFYADEKLLKTACDTVFKLVEHYDRGMVYQFKDDLSGKVVHEIKKDWVDTSYMGMRFPASDIPLPARQLFVKNGLRYVQNIESDYNPIIDKDHADLDLSHCRMRAVSRPHIVYLKNMGVVSSLSISIVVNGELWGLFAFHGYREPFKPSLHQRIACESIMSMVSVKVESLTRKAESARVIDLSETLMRWEQSHSVAHNLANCSNGLLSVFDADVVVGRLEDPLKDEPETVIIGDSSFAPDDSTFWEKLESQPARKLVHTSTRKGIAAMGITQAECPASGFVYFHDGLVRVMIGRAPRAKDVVWAGNPDEPKLRIGGILCPRNSFETFMEKAREETQAWDSTDLHVLNTFMDRVCEHSHNRNATLLKNDIEDANIKYFGALERSEDNSQFFAQMSHELRTPFHGVMGCLNLMHDSIQEMSNNEIQDLINTALSTGNHMINLLNDILSISKDKHQKQLLNLESMKISDLVAEPLDNLRSLALRQKITLSLQLEPNDANVVVSTDKKKYLQIISNILNNSIKFAEGGSIDIKFELLDSMVEAVNSWGIKASSFAGTVFSMHENDMFDSVENVKTKVAQLSERTGTNSWILASIADSGCGIKPSELQDMLKPYTQSSRGANRTFQGTGLGLFICVSLSHQLNGFLSCSSTPGVGSVFHIGIPVGNPNEEAAQLPESVPTVIGPAVAGACCGGGTPS